MNVEEVSFRAGGEGKVTLLLTDAGVNKVERGSGKEERGTKTQNLHHSHFEIVQILRAFVH